jgi:hypothetical protein
MLDRIGFPNEALMDALTPLTAARQERNEL